jgi:uncharacterized membrane protein YphA (DoxX/SURF4 family)
MNIVLWILQGVIAMMFGMAGFMKLSKSRNELQKAGENMKWTEDISDRNVKLIGLLEVLAALGLILPSITGLMTWLTPVAAIGLSLTMIGAMVLHIRRQDGAKAIAMNFMLMIMAAFIAFGRFAILPV